ncbi:MAG TPA: DUF6542 domain-containing protein [Pseudonocardiaceae bacterium]|jgi:hypothetical protein
MTLGGYRDEVLSNDPPASWQDGSALSSVRGIPWWAAVLLALAFTGIGVFADLERINRLGIIFQGCYFAGCLLAVMWVQRRGLFGPMVQPPLILALAVPGVVLASGGGVGDSLTAKALAVGTPLINGFPTMAITTGVTVLIGFVRIARQHPPRQARVAASRSAASRSAAGRSAAGRSTAARRRHGGAGA